MFPCEKCCREFKTKWQLQRHYSKKIPCKKVTPNGSSLPPNGSSLPPNGSFFTPNGSSLPPNGSFSCKYCFECFSRKDKLKTHNSSCREKEDIVRYLEMELDLEPPKAEHKNQCRFCNKCFSHKTNHTRHLKTCHHKQEYKLSLEHKMKNRNSSVVNNTVNNQINVNISLNQFGNETTEHISNSYLRKIISNLELSLPKVVSTVAKQIYCNNKVPENHTLQITNLRSQWAKISNGNNYELQTIQESVDGVRNKVTDLYIERQTDEPEYFDDVSRRIETLDEINNQKFVPQNIVEKEEQKEYFKLKNDIEREIKSSLYNLQKVAMLS